MKFWRTAWLLIVLTAHLVRCEGDLSVTLVSVTSDPSVDDPEWEETYCGVYDTSWSDIPARHHPGQFSSAVAPSPSDPFGCHGDLPSPLAGVSLVLREGNCSYYQQALRAQLADASLLVIVYSGSDLSNLADETSRFEVDNSSLPSIHTQVVFVERDSGNTILSHISSGVNITTYVNPLPPFDPSVVLIFAIAVFTVFLAAFIANTPWEFMRYGLLVRKGEDYNQRATQSAEAQCGGTKTTVAGTIAIMLLFVLFICGFLMLLYLFYYPMVYVVIALYCLGTLVGLYTLASPYVALVPLLSNLRLPSNKLPLLEYRPDPKFFLTVIFCVAIVVWWAVERHAVYAWILQDILGFAFLTFLISRLLFLRTWIVAILMVFLLFYDIFMVFITPFFTKDHESVMVKAATGGESSSNGGTPEQLPIVFAVPKFLVSDLETTCADYIGYYPWSLLGFGDVGIPGLLVALSLYFDYHQRPKSRLRLYYLTSGVAYVVGLMVTVVALILMQTPQPALLYLVPTTLGSVVLLSLFRKEFVLFFTGKPYSQWRQERRREGSDCVGEGTGRERAGSDVETETELNDGDEGDALISKEE